MRIRIGWGLVCACPPVGASRPPRRATRTNDPAGTYPALVSDAGSCLASGAAALTSNEAIPLSCCGNGTGRSVLSIGGANPDIGCDGAAGSMGGNGGRMDCGVSVEDTMEGFFSISVICCFKSLMTSSICFICAADWVIQTSLGSTDDPGAEILVGCC